MTTLTPEQRQAALLAGESPVRLEDPETHESYVLLRADVYERLRGPTPQGQPDWRVDAIPEGIRRSQEAFFRDLPELLKDKRLRGKWVAYHGDERIGIAKTDDPLIRECIKRGLKREEYDMFVIEPQSPEPEEITLSSAGFEIHDL